MNNRLTIINNHLSTKFPPQESTAPLSEYRKKSEYINKDLLMRHYMGSSYQRVLQIRDFIKKSPLFNHFYEEQLSTPDLRFRIIDQIKAVYSQFPTDFAIDKQNPLQKFEILYALAEYDMQTSTRLLVNFVFYLDTITNLGTSKHRNLIDRCFTLEDYGCMALTELGHGSNTGSLETTATYIKETNEFIINSPTPTSAKWWIGAASQTANMANVFAQLIIDSVNYGLHVFTVPIRDSAGNPVPQVVLGDCGKKALLNGIENGFIIFNNYKVPYFSLLDKYSEINADGEFVSKINNPQKRMIMMLGGLARGRLAVVSGSEINLKSGLAIAIRYSALRKQFSLEKGSEVPILSYQIQKFRLMPVLAQNFAIRAGILYLYQFFKSNTEKFANEPECEELSEFHAVLSCYKAICNWYSMHGLQQCREACGGLGYSLFSGIGRIRANQDVQLAWEGDNTDTLQQTSKYIIKQIQKSFKAQKSQSTTLKFVRNSPLDEVKLLKNYSEKLSSKDINELNETKFHYLLQQSLLKLQENSIKSSSIIEAWNNSQVFYLNDLAKSYGEYLLTKNLYDFADSLSEESKNTGETITKLANLYGLTVIDQNLSVLLEIGLDSKIVKIVKDDIVSLCEDVGEYAVGIIDAIAQDDVCLGSAIGSSDGMAYAKMIEAVENHPNAYKTPEWLPILNQIKNK